MTFRYSSGVTTILSTGRQLTIDDLDGLEGLAADGNRYELVEGSLHVASSPAFGHQRVVANLLGLLWSSCPSGFEVVPAPLDVVLAGDTLVQPDLLVTRVADRGTRRLVGPPLLAVEVLSPDTRVYDLGTKRLVYEQAGVGAYWVVDPVLPSITEWRWAASGSSRAVERTVAGDHELSVDWPFAATVVPGHLVRPGG